MGSAWSFRRGLPLSVVIPALWGEAIRLQAGHRRWVKGLGLAPCSLLVDELGVAGPRVVGDAVAYGLAVAIARGPGDAAVGRGEAVAAGDALWVWAEVDTIAAPTTARVAPNRRDIFIRDKD
jgi:hypothetical protein